MALADYFLCSVPGCLTKVFYDAATHFDKGSTVASLCTGCSEDFLIVIKNIVTQEEQIIEPFDEDKESYG